MYCVGLTGGIGSGKSAAATWFMQQSIEVINADLLAREVVEPDQPAFTQIVEHFGRDILLDNGTLNRRALRELVFSNPRARQYLEYITHPHIRQLTQIRIDNAKSPYVILESPLLFESSQHHLVNRTLLIDVSEAVQIERIMARDDQLEAQVKQIIAVQMPSCQKRLVADDIVVNNGSLEQLYQQLFPLHQSYLMAAAALAPR